VAPINTSSELHIDRFAERSNYELLTHKQIEPTNVHNNKGRAGKPRLEAPVGVCRPRQRASCASKALLPRRD